MADDLPIDIHSSKLLDWLVSRRHCERDWSKNVNEIREKIKHAILDMPEHEDIVRLLQGSYINYFHCTQIVNLLKETEKDSKNFFGYYSSQRMKDWKEIVSLYESNNLYLGESAQLLQRLVQYDIPAVKRLLQKKESAVEELAKKARDYERQKGEALKQYDRNVSDMGIKGTSLRAELLSIASDLPKRCTELTGQIKALSTVRNAYEDFTKNLGASVDSSRLLPLLSLVIQSPDVVTVYEWKNGKKPTSLQPPNFDLLLQQDKSTTEAASTDEIDFGGADEDVEIDFGDDSAEISVLADGSGTDEDSGIARDEDALSVVESVNTQRVLLYELLELEAWLDSRQHDSNTSHPSDVYLASLHHPTVSAASGAALERWLQDVRKLIADFRNPQAQHLFKIRSSPQYVETVVAKLLEKREAADQFSQLAELSLQNSKQAKEEALQARAELDKLAKSTRQLQQHVEEALSKKYSGRPVHIMGGINAALAVA